MAKKMRVNKSAKVREYLTAKPDAGPTEVADALKEYKISPGFVSNIKTKLKKQRGGIMGRRSGRGGGGAGHDGVVAAAQLIHLCGGIEQAEHALKAAEKVAEALHN